MTWTARTFRTITLAGLPALLCLAGTGLSARAANAAPAASLRSILKHMASATVSAKTVHQEMHILETGKESGKKFSLTLHLQGDSATRPPAVSRATVSIVIRASGRTVSEGDEILASKKRAAEKIAGVAKWVCVKVPPVTSFNMTTGYGTISIPGVGSMKESSARLAGVSKVNGKPSWRVRMSFKLQTSASTPPVKMTATMSIDQRSYLASGLTLSGTVTSSGQKVTMTGSEKLNHYGEKLSVSVPRCKK